MAFQIRDLLADVSPAEHEGYFLGCEHPSCGRSLRDLDGGGDHGGKYAAAAELALLQQQLQQSLSLEL